MKFRNPWTRARRTSQALVLVAIMALVWNTKYPLQLPVDPGGLFHLDPLVTLLTAVAERIWLDGIWISLGVLILTFAFGRFFCGWFCPLGAVMDLMARAVKAFRRFREHGSRSPNWIKYMLLGVLVVLALLGWQGAWLLDPLTLFVRTFSFVFHPLLNNALDQGWMGLSALFGHPDGLEVAYDQFRTQWLALNHLVFPHAGAVGALFMLVLVLVLVQRRFWCRYLCPLGAGLGLSAALTPFRRQASDCPDGCQVCRQLCRTQAIQPDGSLLARECVMCYDCVERCPQQRASFHWSFAPRSKTKVQPTPGKGISRAQFMAWVMGAVLTARSARADRAVGEVRTVIRPPGALTEKAFLQRCIRCGNCMKVCLTNVLQPVWLEAGTEGIWTPRVAPEVSYCEFQCRLCGQVCPTDAIRSLTPEEKVRFKIGQAEVKQKLCVPWVDGKPCLVCEEHCPVTPKAIQRLVVPGRHGLIQAPVVLAERCIGCAICENKCPVGPEKAIRVRPL